MKNVIACWLLLLPWITSAQNSLDLDFGIAKSQTTVSISATHDWVFGKRQKLFAGVGGRLTFYTAHEQYYATAPAIITSGARGPQVFFVANIKENMDSLFVGRPAVAALNASINLGYRINGRFAVGFNIDAIGFSLGRKVNGMYINGNSRQTVDAKVTSFNALLVSDNDYGTLNSQLYLKYRPHKQFGLKAGAQFLFTEYTTDHDIQQFPRNNDRFRRKSLMAMIGATWYLDN